MNFCLAFECDPTKGCFRFAALQSDTGQSLLTVRPPHFLHPFSPLSLLTPFLFSPWTQSFGLDTMVFDTIVLVEPDGRHYIKSEAVLRIASRLRQPFPQLASLARLFPVDFRDSVYAFVSARRHIFGESENCRCVSQFQYRSTACVAG